MTITNHQIRATLARYLERHPDEINHMTPLIQALDKDHDLASRHEFRIGHATAGAAVIDSNGRVLLIRHKTLDTWLLPGGHLEPEDSSLHAASLRELDEETGIRRQHGVSPLDDNAVPLDIDIHRIPDNPTKQEPTHLHFDFRFAHTATGADVELQLDEVTDHTWHPVAHLPTGRLNTKLTALAAT